MKPLFLFLLFCSLTFYTKAQEKVWKRRVSRTIDIRDMDHPEKSTHGILSAVLIKAVKAQKVVAYTAFDNNFTTVMTPEELAVRFEQQEIQIQIDRTANDTIYKQISNEILPDSIYKYRLFEEWSFNLASGKFTIQIKYVAPIRNIYSSDGKLIGRQPLFWISYHDFSSAMEVNDIKQIQPFYRCLWQSNFDAVLPLPTDDYFNEKTGLWSANATTTIDMYEQPDTFIHFLRNENNDTLLSELIINEIKNEKIPCWTGYDHLLSPQLTKKDVMDLVKGRVDTYSYPELPITGTNEGRPTIIEEDFNYSSVHNYTLLQSWSFNSITGKTEVDIKTVGLIGDMYGDDGSYRGTKTMFWIRYPDLQPILNKVEQYHPTNTFAMHIWDNFFLSDRKPVLEK